MIIDIDQDIYGYDSFDVYQIDNNTIELYNPFNDTSYFLNGYQRSNFDYDYVFYDNIQYFMQKYEAWEKTYTSDYGVLNEFDNENFLQFLSGGNDNTFRSSQDPNGINPNNLYWDYTGNYGPGQITEGPYTIALGIWERQLKQGNAITVVEPDAEEAAEATAAIFFNYFYFLVTLYNYNKHVRHENKLQNFIAFSFFIS